MKPEAGAPDWARVKEAFAAAVARPPGERAAFLAAECGDDAALCHEVESLLASHDAAEAEAFIARAPGLPAEDRGPIAEGQRVGPYRVLGEIGRGGMGTVYRAVRDDDEYRKVVAVKVVWHSLDSTLAERLKAERQILAALEHAGIARLLDGGTTADGLHWLAMEYVEGEPITEYAEHRRLLVSERLLLFREVCSAVHYAHQMLVVHRDIKPGNILVSPAGHAKLLDFGIAKLLEAQESAGATPTLTTLLAMTPEYASPEQARGLPVTTATDVYSLGVLLCELLTGRRPYRLPSRDPAEMARVITTIEPERPSDMAARAPEATRARRRQLEGDLDNIVLMALRKEPERRYASVNQLSEDIRLHLEGRPVIARPDTFRYRASKFVRRNRVSVTAALAVLLSLVGGLVATAWQAREARRERALAERRFEDVRALASSFLFEFHDSIAKLPGSTAARQLLVTRAIQYLDRLAQEGGDASLRKELTRGYIRLGDIQGRPNSANLGDTQGALASYRKALAHARSAVDASPRDVRARTDLGTALLRVGTLLADGQGDAQGALVAAREALSVMEATVADAPQDNDALLVLLYVDTKLGDLLMQSGQNEEALAIYRQALPRYEAVAARTGSRSDRFSVFVAHSKVGGALSRLGRNQEALASYEAMLSIIQAIVDADANDAPARRSLAVALNKMGDLQDEIGDSPGALARYRAALALREALVPADPRNVLARSDLVGSYIRIGDLLAKTGDRAGALAQYMLALPILEALAARNPQDRDNQADLAGAEVRIASLQAQRGRPEDALARHARVLPAFEALLKLDPGNMEARFDLAAAILAGARIQAQLAGEATTSSGTRAGRWTEARSSYARSLELWREIGPRSVTGKRCTAGTPAENARVAEAGLRRCDEALQSLAAR